MALSGPTRGGFLGHRRGTHKGTVRLDNRWFRYVSLYALLLACMHGMGRAAASFEVRKHSKYLWQSICGILLRLQIEFPEVRPLLWQRQVMLWCLCAGGRGAGAGSLAAQWC